MDICPPLFLKQKKTDRNLRINIFNQKIVRLDNFFYNQSMYLYLKAFHIIFIVTWFSGLFYLVRLFIYHVEAEEHKGAEEKKILQQEFSIMEKRLWYGITWPSCILTFLFGTALMQYYSPLNSPWIIIKLILVLLLFLYHLYCGRILKQLQQKSCRHSSNWLRMWNEGATVFLVSIVFLAILKNAINASMAFLGLSTLILILFFSIRIYARIRSGQTIK
ncbi:MAG: CopD family protein [Halobacteriovoraceae bacterium]|nr:CopD family protein [Halobacteriovoraceae bacterium]